MVKQRSQQARPTPKTDFDWRSHPVIVASGSAAATFLITLAVFTQLVSPTQTAKLEIELLKLKDAEEKINNANKTLEAQNNQLASETKMLRAETAALQQELVESKAANLFITGNPYPIGLGLVRIGMPRSEIEKVYSGQKIESSSDHPEIVSVSLTNSPFERVAFYLTDKTKSATISHISFNTPLLDSKYSSDFLHRKLVENFGAPSKESTPKISMWKVGTSYSIFEDDYGGYVLMRRGAQPAFWALR